MAVCPPSFGDGTLVLAFCLTTFATPGKRGPGDVWDHHVCCGQGIVGWQFGSPISLCHLMLLRRLENGSSMSRPQLEVIDAERVRAHSLIPQ